MANSGVYAAQWNPPEAVPPLVLLNFDQWPVVNHGSVDFVSIQAVDPESGTTTQDTDVKRFGSGSLHTRQAPPLCGGLKLVPRDPIVLDGDFAVQCWFRRNSAATATLFSLSRADGTGGFRVIMGDASVNVVFYTHENVQLGVPSQRADALRVGVWQHLSLFRQRNYAVIYLDGKEWTSWAFCAETMTTGSDGAIWVGNYLSHDPNCFDGWIDDFRILGPGCWPQISTSMPSEPYTT